VRNVAARAIASLPPAPEIMIPLWEKMVQSADEPTMRAALNALAGLGPAAVPRLIDMLKYPKLRPQVIYLIGANGAAAAAATEPLTKLLSDPDDRVAAEAALALGSIGAPAKGAVPALIAAIDHEEASRTRALVFALGRIGPDAAAAEPKLTQLMNS